MQLMCAALWEIVRQGAVMYYGLLEEFIASVLETVSARAHRQSPASLGVCSSYSEEYKSVLHRFILVLT